jgi:hypothetical protein
MDEVVRIVDNPSLRVLILMCSFTGLRMKEVAQLRQCNLKKMIIDGDDVNVRIDGNFRL